MAHWIVDNLYKGQLCKQRLRGSVHPISLVTINVSLLTVRAAGCVKSVLQTKSTAGQQSLSIILEIKS